MHCLPATESYLRVCWSEWLQMVFGAQMGHGAPLMSSLLPTQVVCTVICISDSCTAGTADAWSNHLIMSGETMLLFLSSSFFIFCWRLHLPLIFVSLSSVFLSWLFAGFWPFIICILSTATCVCSLMHMRVTGSVYCWVGRSSMFIEGTSDAFP